MAEVIIAAAALLALIGQAWFLLHRTDKREAEIEARHATILAISDRRVDGLLDRIQAPDLETVHALRAPPTPDPDHEWRYDDTGLIRLDLAADDDGE